MIVNKLFLVCLLSFAWSDMQASGKKQQRLKHKQQQKKSFALNQLQRKQHEEEKKFFKPFFTELKHDINEQHNGCFIKNPYRVEDCSDVILQAAIGVTAVCWVAACIYGESSQGRL